MTHKMPNVRAHFGMTERLSIFAFTVNIRYSLFMPAIVSFYANSEKVSQAWILIPFRKPLLTYCEVGHIFREVLDFGTSKPQWGQPKSRGIFLGLEISLSPWSQPEPIEISFSECGEYVVASTGSSNPVVFLLPPWALSSNAPSTIVAQTLRERRNQAEVLESSAPVIESPKSTLSDFGQEKALSCQQGILTTHHNAFDSNGQRSGLRLSHADDSIRLHQDQARDNGKDPESLLLTHLPNWAGENVDVSVRNSNNLENSIQIVLNKATKPWSELSAPADQHLPAIVTRDKRAIRERSIASGQYCSQAKMLEDVSSTGETADPDKASSETLERGT